MYLVMIFESNTRPVMYEYFGSGFFGRQWVRVCFCGARGFAAPIHQRQSQAVG